MAAIEVIRTKGEALLGTTLRRLNRKHRKRIKAAIRNSGSLDAIPQSFWVELQAEIDREVVAVLLLLFIFSHESTQNKLKFQWSKQKVETAGKQYATERARKLATLHVRHTRDRLQAAKRDVETAAEMETKIDDILSDDRAESVAITETTTAISGGQSQGGEDFKKERPEQDVVVLWKTEFDAKVCPICRPLHMKREPTWASRFPDGPPAHVNCRCEKLFIAKKSKEK